MNSNYKLVGVFTLLLVALVAFTATANALPQLMSVEVNGNDYRTNTVIDRAENLDLEFEIYAAGNETDVQLSAEILGYEYSDYADLSATTHNFDMTAGDTEFQKLSLKIPAEMDKDYFDVRARVGSKTGPSEEYLYRIHVKGDRHLLSVKTVYFSPENEVKAGSTLISKVKIKNLGESTEKDISVRVSIPALGVSEVVPLELVEQDESETTEELYLRIPRDAKAGEYKVVVSIEYDEYEKVTKEYTIDVSGTTVQETEKPQVKPSIINVAVDKQDVTKGQSGAIYPVTITNQGTEAKTFTLTADADWADLRVSPSNVIVVNGGDSKAVYVYVSAKETAAAGEQVFGLEIKSGEEVKSVTLKANVLNAPTSSWDSTKKALEIALVVLVVILVIVGLVIAFSRNKGDDVQPEEPEVANQTYY